MSQDNPNVQENESPEQKADKVQKNYERVLSVVTKVVGGKENLLPKKKVDGDTTASIVAELFKEEAEANREQVKNGLKELLKKHVEAGKKLSEKQKELDKYRQEIQKDFTDAANKWLNQVDQAEINAEAYANSLQTAFRKAPDSTETAS